MKITVSLDDEGLYRSLKVQAARSGRSVRDLIAEAIGEWLDRREEAEDVELATHALAEYEREGGVEAKQFLRTLAAEVQSAYGSDIS
jgi:plasmid stability protein